MKTSTSPFSLTATKFFLNKMRVLLVLVFLGLGMSTSFAQITSAQTGPWFTASTWVGGVVPTSASNVVIAAGHTVTVDAAVTRNAGTTTTVNVTGTLEATATYTNSGTTTINGSLQVSSGGSISTNPPVYGAASTLIYNGTSNTAPEWTGGASTTVAAGAGVPANVIVAAGTLTISAANGVPGNLQINPSCGLILTTGTLYIGGNLTNNGNFFANNSQAIEFVGTGTSVITAASGTQVLDGLVIAKTSGSVQIGSTSSLTIASSAGSVLQFLNAGTLDLNGRTIRFNANGGNILVDGTQGGTIKHIISSTSQGIIAIQNTKTVSGIAGGSLDLSIDVKLLLTGSFNPGAITTINGTLQIATGGSLITNPPIYGVTSLLNYSSGTIFGRGVSWNVGIGTVGVTPGYPNDVLISNNTTFDAPNVGSSPFSIALKCGGNLTIDAGSGFFMDYGGGNNKSGFLKVDGDLLMNGALSLGDAFGGDLFLAGNFTNNGAFIDNGRGIIFNGTGPQTIAGTSTIDFPHMTINNTSGTSVGITLASPVNVANTLTLMAGVVNTTATNILNVSGTTTGAINGGSLSSHIKGPMSRSFPANLVSGSNYIFPVGKGASGYYPFTFNNLTSGASGPIVRVEAFSGSTGGTADGTTLGAISTSEYWATSNTGTLTNCSVSVTRPTAIGASNAIGKSATLTGAYSSIGGTVSGNSIINSNTINSLGYFVMGTLAIPITLSSNNIAAGNITQGTTTNAIYSFAITASSVSATLTGLNITTNGSYASADITNLKVYYSASTPFVLGSSTLLSTLTTPGAAGSKTFPSFSQTIAANATGYIYIIAVVPCGATAGNTIGVNAITSANTTFTSGAVSGTPAAGNTQTIVAAAPVNATSVVAASASSSSVMVSWVAPAGCYSEVMIVASPAANTGGTPTGNGSAYTGSLSYGSGTAFGNGFVSYKGTTSPQTISGLNSGTQYYFKIFTRNGSSWSSGVEVSGATSSCGSPTDNVWTGSVSTVWQNGANWCSGAVPTGITNVTIPSGTPFSPVLNYSPAVNNIIIQTGATVGLSTYNLTVNGTLSGTGKFVGTKTSKLTLAGSGALGTLYLNASGLLSCLSISGTGSSLTLGSALNIYDTLDVKGNNLATGGFLTIKSTLNNTGRIAPVTGSGAITGTATVERYLPSNPFRAWRLLSVPVQGAQTFKQSWQENQAPMLNGVPGYGTILTSSTGGNGYDTITTGNSLLQWNGTAYTGVAATTNPMATNKGYFVYIRGDRSVTTTMGVPVPTPSGATTLRTTGTLNDGVSQTSIAAAAGLNILVGNVYASPIDFLNITKTGITAFKLWDPKLQGSNFVGGYQTFSASTSPAYVPVPGGGSFGSTPNTRIESGQAFFVSSTSGGSITLTEAAKTTGSRNVMRGTAPKAQIKATLYAATATGQAIVDGNVVVFDNTYSNGSDDNDIIKVTNFGENFGINNNGSTLVVDARKDLSSETDNVIEYNISSLKKQQYTLEFSAQNIEAGVNAYLEDKYLGTKTPVSLTSKQNVTFQVTADAASSAAGRFRIVLQREVKLPTEISKGEIKITPNPVTDGQINLQFISQPEGKYTVRLLTASGQIIQSRVASFTSGTNTYRMSITSKLSGGVYKIEVVKPNGEHSVQNLLISNDK